MSSSGDKRLKPQRFRSRIDSWLLVLLAVAVLAQAYALVDVMSGAAAGGTKAIVAAVTLLGILLIGSLLFRTHYTVTGGTLRIVSGPFAWTIPLSEIIEITESRSLLSSPALSLDRLKIRYRRNRCILVSPDDKKGFVNAIRDHSERS